MHKDAVQEIEQDIREAKKFTEMFAALERLSSNRDFKKIIQEGYFEKESVRLVHLKADPAMQRPESQLSIVKQIDAIGALSSYFRTIEFTADQAVKSIEAMEEAREEILREAPDA